MCNKCTCLHVCLNFSCTWRFPSFLLVLHVHAGHQCLHTNEYLTLISFLLTLFSIAKPSFMICYLTLCTDTFSLVPVWSLLISLSWLQRCYRAPEDISSGRALTETVTHACVKYGRAGESARILAYMWGISSFWRMSENSLRLRNWSVQTYFLLRKNSQWLGITVHAPCVSAYWSVRFFLESGGRREHYYSLIEGV